jgi:uncharacterized paraquat-inducible protein A
MVEQTKCPECNTEFDVPSYNKGACPNCKLKYSWVTIGVENSESTEGPHDYIHWEKEHEK